MWFSVVLCGLLPCVIFLARYHGEHMAGITQEQADAQLASYLAAESAVLAGQSYELNGRKLTRANLAEIQSGIAIWDRRAKSLSRGGIRVIGATPIG